MNIEKARSYARARRILWVADVSVTFGLLIGFVASGWNTLLEQWVVSWVSGWALQVGVYVAFLGIGMSLVSFPLDFVRGFLLEQRFGLSSLRCGSWVREHAKHLLVGGALGLVLVEGLFLLLKKSPASWWMWAALLWLGWSVLLTRMAPILLIPIFYKQKPLADQDLRRRLEMLLTRCGTKVQGIFEVDVSRTTAKANACLCGLGRTRRVLVSDTLVSRYPAQEIEAVLAHELGHHALHHIGMLLAMGVCAAGFSFFAVDVALKNLIQIFKLGELDRLAVLPWIGLLLFLANLILMPVTRWASRILEAQADRYALRTTKNPKAFIDAMRRLADQNLAELSPPAWVEWLFEDHPSIGKRIAMAETYSE